MQAPRRPRETITKKETIVLRKIAFSSGSGEIASEAMPDVQHVADVMKAHPEFVRVGVEGHAAPSEANGATLSEQRAAHIVQALVGLGIDPARLTAYGAGPWCYPIAMTRFLVLVTTNGPTGAQQCDRTADSSPDGQ